MHQVINAYLQSSANTVHRYWRVNVSAADGGSNIAIFELHMRDGRNGPNLCTNSANASASSNVTNHDPSNGFDGHWDEGGFIFAWAGTTNANEWLAYDFGAGNEKAIVAVDIWARPETAFLTQSPKDFTVQYSDNASTWTTAWSVTGQTAWRTREHRKFVDPSYAGADVTGTHAYWRIMITENHGAAGNCGIGEIEFRAAVGVSQGSTGGTPLASSELGGTWSAAKAFAGDAGTTFWVGSAGPGGNIAQWIQYAHSSARSVAQLQLTSRNDAFQTECPKYFQLLWSDNGSNWTNAADFNRTSVWTANLSLTFNV